MKTYLKKRGIGLFYLESKTKASLCENAIKKIKRVLFLKMRLGKNVLWPDIYEKAINQLNIRPMKVLGNLSPKQVNSPFDDIESRKYVEDKEITQPGPIYEKGDLVFLELPKNIGEKDYDLSRAVIARVREVDKSAKPYMYKLETTTGKNISKKYYGMELKLSPSLRGMKKQIEKVFKSRRKNKKREYLIQYEGDRFDYIFRISFHYYSFHFIYIGTKLGFQKD